jgi:5'/3'-nucleotidase SurE
VQVGLYHLFADRGPIDLVVSGPNYGRNTTAVFSLSSGTLGGAFEAAACRQKAIALSYGFFTRNHDPVIIAAACRHSVKVIEALMKQWPEDGSVDLYSVNVPLVETVETAKVLWTEILQNYWSDAGCFTAADVSVDGGDEEEESIREKEGGQPDETTDQTSKHKHFKWSPRFTDVYKSVEDAPPGNDGWAVKEGHTR